jgi:DNA-binding Lrp family transcriptional regulator
LRISAEKSAQSETSPFGGEAAMREGLTVFEKRLCNALQIGLPIVERPYVKIGKDLGVNEQTALKHTRELLKRGVIRRIGAVINWRAIGKASTLVTVCVPEKKLKKVVAAVNSLEGVSHNYLREHHYNLWFTLRADSQGEINAILTKLSKQFGLEFHSLPVKRTFKLDVRFDARSDGRRLLSSQRTLNNEQRTSNLNAIDKRIIEKLQDGLKVTARPYDFFDDEFENYDCLLHIAGMIEEGIIYRIGAVVNHHKLGFIANAMFVCKISEAKIVKVGQKLAKLNIVSHCYERYNPAPHAVQGNLFAMMHGRSQTDIQRQIEKFVRENGIKKWEAIRTVMTLKK